LRIALLNDRLYPDFIGGVEKRFHDLASALARRGHEVTLIGFGSIASRPDVSVRSLGPQAPLYNSSGKRSSIEALRFALEMPRLDLSKYDVVEASNIPFLHLIPLALRCAIERKPLLVSWAEFWGPYWKGYVGPLRAPWYRLVEWVSAQLGSSVTATSELTAERLRKRRLRRGGVPVAFCGVQLEVMLDHDIRKTERPTLVFAGRLIREKRVDLLLHAMTTVDADLIVFGDGPEKVALVALAEQLGVTPRVDFRGHAETSAEVWETIASSWIAVQPSSREGFGIFPLEAMTLGVPVIYCASEDSAVRELVRDGVEGICSLPEAAALSQNITGLLRDASLRRTLSVNATARASSFHIDKVAVVIEAEMRAAIDRVLNRGAVPAPTVESTL
jgi:glycosyltransferase involved in cell wall biosynthesis